MYESAHMYESAPTNDEELVSIEEGHPVVLFPVVSKTPVVDHHLGVRSGVVTVRKEP